MTSSGTYTYNPGAGDIFLAAYSMCGIRRADITTEHLIDATFQANMVLADFANRNPHQWAFETQSVALTSGIAAYSLATRTITIETAYIETTSGSTTTARILAPLSASVYASLPNKAQQGFPNSYWFNLAVTTPQITLYFVPDSALSYTLKVASFRQMQDISPASGQTLDIPYRFLDAFVANLAFRLAINYAPDRTQALKGVADERFVFAVAQDQERVNMHFVPGLSTYFR